MNVSRKFTHRTITAVAVLASAAGLVACGGQRDPSAEQQVRPGLNRMEHEAHRHLKEVRGEQARVLNQREHLAHRDTDGWAASDVKRGEHVGRKSASKRTPIASPTACAAAAEALEALLRLTRQEDGRVYRMDGTYSAGSALTQELCE